MRPISISLFCKLMVFLVPLCCLSTCDSVESFFQKNASERIEDGSSVQTEWKNDTDSTLSLDKIEVEREIKKGSPDHQVQLSHSSFPNRRAYSIQVGSFASRSNAERLSKELVGLGFSPRTILSTKHGKRWNVVRIGGFSKKRKAIETAKVVAEKTKLRVAIIFNKSVVKMVPAENHPNKEKVKKKSGPREKVVAREKSKKGTVKEKTERDRYGKNKKYTFQVGGLHTGVDAQKYREKLKKKGYSPYIAKVSGGEKGEVWYSIRIGYYDTLENAVEAAIGFSAKENIPAQAKRIDDGTKIDR